MRVDIHNTENKYNIIYADPPWSYKAWNAKDGHKSASAHYATMSKQEIQNLGDSVKNIAADNCVLFLWVTMPNLPEGIELIEKWGFTYKTCAFSWVKTYKNGKPVVGLGYWTRSNNELCLLATRGGLRRVNNSVSQIVIEPPREHSSANRAIRKTICRRLGLLGK